MIELMLEPWFPDSHPPLFPIHNTISHTYEFVQGSYCILDTFWFWENVIYMYLFRTKHLLLSKYSKEKYWHSYEVINNTLKENTRFCSQNEVVSAMKRTRLNDRTLCSVPRDMRTELSFRTPVSGGGGEECKGQCRAGSGKWTHCCVNSEGDLGATPLVSCSLVPCQPLLWASCLSQRLL